MIQLAKAKGKEMGVNGKHDVCIQVFANNYGLCGSVAAHLNVSPNTFREFIHGFTQSGPLVNWIDVGHGKDKADGKVNGKPMYRVLPMW